MTHKAIQPRLLPKLAPIRNGDALTIDALTTRYRCRCGHTAETGIRLEAVTCTKCGAAIKASMTTRTQTPDRSSNL